jgi:acetyltransferase-like isoleucine patch superfamily enzyme
MKSRNLISEVINKPWLLVSELKMLFVLPLAYVYLLFNRAGIRFPFKFYGLPRVQKHKGSQIIIGQNFENRNWASANFISSHQRTVLATNSSRGKILIGNNVGISGSNIVSETEITIGDSTIIGSNCLIIDTDFHPMAAKNRRHSKKGVRSKSIKIGKNVFVGTRSIILPGVIIGDNTIIGAGSVVRRSVPANSIYVDGKITKLKK